MTQDIKEKKQEYDRVQKEYVSMLLSSLTEGWEKIDLDNRNLIQGKLEKMIEECHTRDELPITDFYNAVRFGQYESKKRLFDHFQARNIRVKNRLKQQELGEITGVPQATLSAWETGKQLPGSKYKDKYYKWLLENGYKGELPLSTTKEDQ